MPRNQTLLNLVRDNAARQHVFDVRAEGSNATAIYLYDVIDAYWGVSAASFVQALAAIDTPVINLHINSPGGDVFEARAMATAIRQHPAEIIAHIDGIAASAATYVATSARQVNIAEGAFMMVHKAWTLAMGNAEEIGKVAALLDKIDGSLVADYARKTGKSEAVIAEWMAAETWFTAQEAVDAGFADQVTAADANGSADGAQNRWNLSAYSKVPKALIAPPAPTQSDIAYNRAADRAALERRLTLFEKIAT